jgi:ribosome maturation factor RimP
MVIKILEQLLEEKFKTDEFKDFYVVDIESYNPGSISVFIDSDSGLTTSQCARVSRYLEEYLDGENFNDGKYNLEISSPGVDRPLKFPRQYIKNKGRKVDLVTQDGENIRAKILDANEDYVVLEYRDKIKEGKKKKNIVKQLEIPYEAIKKAKIRISFN